MIGKPQNTHNFPFWSLLYYDTGNKRFISFICMYDVDMSMSMTLHVSLQHPIGSALPNPLNSAVM
jgi:hypothetical protein